MKSWDRTQIPKPFATVALVFAPPIVVPREATDERIALDGVSKSRGLRAQALADCDAEPIALELLMSLVLVTSDRFADHSRRRAIPSGSSGPRRCRSSRRVGGRRAATCSRRVRQPTRICCACTTPAISRRSGGARVARRCSTPTPSRRPNPKRSRGWRPGAVLTAVDHVLDDAAGTRGRSRWCARPGITPKRDRAMGFCFYNSIAVGAALRRAPRPRTRRHRRLRRASRQRHAVDLLRRSERALRVVAPISVLSRNRGGDRDRAGRRRRLYRQPADARRARRTPTSTWSIERSRPRAAGVQARS